MTCRWCASRLRTLATQKPSASCIQTPTAVFSRVFLFRFPQQTHTSCGREQQRSLVTGVLLGLSHYDLPLVRVQPLDLTHTTAVSRLGLLHSWLSNLSDAVLKTIM